MPQAATLHRWKFFRSGGFDQVRLDTAADLAALGELDQKLWVALACPAAGLEFDTATLDLIDTDRDGRLRPPEIIAAAKWATSCLKNGDELLRCPSALPLAAIDDSQPEGKRLLASAKQILANLGKEGAASIAIEDVADTTRIFAATKFNGDGVVPADAAGDAAVRQVIEDAIACLGGEPDRSGKPGISRALLARFLAECQAYSDWSKKAEGNTSVLPLGPATAAADAALSALRTKIDDYFGRCRLAAYDARALNALNRSEAEYLAVAAGDLSITVSELASFPLARVEAGRPLPLREGAHPAWQARIDALLEQAVQPLLGERTSLSEADWAALQSKLAAFRDWQAGKAGAAVERLGAARAREILAGGAAAEIEKLIARDEALKPEAESIAAVDRLVRYHRHLGTLLRNFVNFRDFYDPAGEAIFQVGTLYLDRRSCELCVRVEDAGRHGAFAGLSCAYLAYCDCVRKSTGEKMTIAAAFTDGDSDHLMVGRNGVFYDRKGRDWDATITKVVEQPISIREAFWSPYKKFARLVETQIGKLASARDKSMQDAAAAKADAAGAAAAAPPAKKEPFDVARFAGIFAAIGLAIGAIGGALGAMLTAFGRLAAWQIPLALLGIMLVISAPAVVMAWLKLRKRNVGPILDANGWAVNARARVNVPFGRSLTKIGVLPPGAERDLNDPYAESSAGRNWTIAALVLLAALWGLWYFGVLERRAPWLPDSSRVERAKEAEAAEKAAAEAAADQAAAEKAAADAAAAQPAAPAAAPAAPAAPGG